MWSHWSFRFPRLCLHTASHCWYPWADNYKRPLHLLESPWRTSAAGWRRSIVKQADQAVKICKAWGFCRKRHVVFITLCPGKAARHGLPKVWQWEGVEWTHWTSSHKQDLRWARVTSRVSLSCSFTKHKAHMGSAEVQRNGQFWGPQQLP